MSERFEITDDDRSKLLALKDSYRGAKCVLMCNGPSLNQVDFSKMNLDEYVVFGLNKIFLGFETLGIKPNYIVAVNKKVIEQSAQQFSSIDTLKFISNRVSRELLGESTSLCYMNTVRLPPKALRFSKDITDYVYEGWTVTHAALQIIFYMGFQEVNIVGMDHQFKQHEVGRENQTSVVAGDDIDHFHPNYFGHGKEWDLPDLVNSEISYRAAKEAFESDNRSIFDCTIEGKCTIFEKRDIVKQLYID